MYRRSKQKPTGSGPFQGNMTGLKNNEDKLLNLKIMSNCKIIHCWDCMILQYLN